MSSFNPAPGFWDCAFFKCCPCISCGHTFPTLQVWFNPLAVWSDHWQSMCGGSCSSGEICVLQPRLKHQFLRPQPGTWADCQHVHKKTSRFLWFSVNGKEGDWGCCGLYCSKEEVRIGFDRESEIIWIKSWKHVKVISGISYFQVISLFPVINHSSCL